MRRERSPCLADTYITGLISAQWPLAQCWRPLPRSRGFLGQNAAALIALLGVLIASGLGFWQWRRSQQATEALDRAKLQWEREKIGLEDQLTRERVNLEDRLTRERARLDDQQRADARRAKAEEAMQARLRQQMEDADSIGRQAIAYRRALVSELRNLKILDMSKPLDLEALYVQVQVREEEPSRYVAEDEIGKLAQGDPEQLLRLSQTRVVERVAQALAPEEALRRFNRIAVLGDPGAGKTTMLRHLAFRSARGELGEQLTLPVYIELRRFVDSGLADLLEFAAADWSERYGFTDARPYLEQELAAGRSALLLDGLDEVLGGDTIEAATVAYNRVTEEVARLATRFPGAPIAVTCRRASSGGSLTAFQTLEVLDFSWDQIQVFVSNWFAGDPAKGDGLRRALTGDLRMQTMAANPLILSLIAIVYDQELELSLSSARSFTTRCVEVLLKEWDAHRNIRRLPASPRPQAGPARTRSPGISTSAAGATSPSRNCWRWWPSSCRRSPCRPTTRPRSWTRSRRTTGCSRYRPRAGTASST